MRLGVSGWVFLIGLLLGENREVRMQVVIAVIFATIGEHFASPFMGGYTYRFGNVPAYVPPGHGMVYLTAVALARSGLFLRYAREITLLGDSGLWLMVTLGYQRLCAAGRCSGRITVLCVFGLSV